MLGSDDVLSIAIFGAQSDEHGTVYLTDNLGERITSVELNGLFRGLPCQYTIRYASDSAVPMEDVSLPPQKQKGIEGTVPPVVPIQRAGSPLESTLYNPFDIV